jgi:hypothetical protein
MQAIDVLYSKTTQRLLLALFRDNPADGLSYAEILRRTEGGSGAIHRELRQFLTSGLLLERGSPSRRLFTANTSHPLYPELHSIAKKLAQVTTETRLDPLMARTLAKKYLWWQTPDEAARDQQRLVAQVMNMGTFDDVRFVETQLGAEYLRRVLKHALPGHFDPRSWTYWHYRLGLAKPDRVPPLPQRQFA